VGSIEMIDASGFPLAGVPVLQDPNTGSIEASNGVLQVNAPVLNLSQTWNNAAATFQALRLNVTNIACSTSSRVLSVVVNGTEAGGIEYNGQYSIAGSTYGYNLNVAGNCYLPTVYFGGPGVADTIVRRDSAGIVAQRTTTNAQATRIYNTWTDASNYERFTIDWQASANVCLVRTEAAGTGTLRGMSIQQATGELSFYGATPVTQPASADQAIVTLGNANGEIGGLTISAAYSDTEVIALRDKCEELADDVRALSTLVHSLRTALVNLGAIKGAA
jgi:hypothetical protein